MAGPTPNPSLGPKQRAERVKTGDKLGPKDDRRADDDPDQSSIKSFFEKAKRTDFDNEASTQELLREDILDEDPLHRLVEATEHAAFWGKDSTKGLEMMRCMFQSNKSWFTQESVIMDYGKTPLHFAIERKNKQFLDCFIRLCHDKNLKASSALETTNDTRKWNCLHAAIREKLPSSIQMAEVCSVKMLVAPNSEDETPLHMAIKYASPADGLKLLNDLLDVIERRDKAKEHKDVERTGQGLLSTLFKHINSRGLSPYLESSNRVMKSRDRFERAKNKKDGERAQAELTKEESFLDRLRNLIFNTFDVSRILDISRALYGTKGFSPLPC